MSSKDGVYSINIFRLIAAAVRSLLLKDQCLSVYRRGQTELKTAESMFICKSSGVQQNCMINIDRCIAGVQRSRIAGV